MIEGVGVGSKLYEADVMMMARSAANRLMIE